MKTYNFRQVDHVTVGFKQALRDDEPPRQRLLRLLLGDLGQHPLQILHVIVLIPSHRTARDLNTLPDGIIHTFVGNNDVPAFRKGRNYTRDGRECLSVDYAGRSTQKGSDIRLGLHMNVLGAVETRRTARPNAIVSEGLNRLLLERLVGVEIIEVVRGKINDCAAIG